MARLARQARAPVQEIPDSFESQQQELSLSSSDVEADDEYGSQLIQQQLSQEQPAEDDEDDDDDGAVNLFLPDIVDIVNKAAGTPSKKDAQANRFSSLPKSSPLAASRTRNSPRNQIEVPETQQTQNTQSSTQSEELGHFATYMKKQKVARQPKQKSSPLRRPSSRPKPLSRSATPVEAPSEGKPDPYEFPASPEREIKPLPKPQPPAGKNAEKMKAGGKRKIKDAVPAPRAESPEEHVVKKRPRRGQLNEDASVEEAETPEAPVMSKRPKRGQVKEAAPAKRAETPEEPVAKRRPRRGQNKPEYSPGSLRKTARRQSGQSIAPDENGEPPVKRWVVPKSAKKAADAHVNEKPEEDLEEEEAEEQAYEQNQQKEAAKVVPVVAIPLKRTRSRNAELEAEAAAASSAPQSSRSLRDKSNEAANSLVASSSSRNANRKCASCYSKTSDHWHAHLWKEPSTGKHYCNNCHSKDYKKKKRAQSNADSTEPAAKPQTALDILQSPPSTWSKSGKDAAAVTQVPATQSEPSNSFAPPPSAFAVYMGKFRKEASEKVRAESEIQASSPIPETPERTKRAKSSSIAPQSASPRVLRKPRQHFKDTTSPVGPPSASQFPVEPSSPDAQAQERHKTISPAENMKPARTTRQSRRGEQREQSRESVEPPMNARAPRSRKANGAKVLSQIVEAETPEIAAFNMEEVPESLFVSQGEEDEDMDIEVEGDREYDVGQGQAQMIIDDDDTPWEQDMEEDDDAEEDSNEEEEGEPEKGGVSDITSILMAPSPKKLPSQKIVVPPRQLRSQEQKLANGSKKTAVSRKLPASPSPPPAQMEKDEDEDEDVASIESQRDGSLTECAADDSQTTMDYGRNPFNEPTFSFSSSSFSATSKCFIKDMPLDPDVRELFKMTKELRTIVAGVDRHTQQAKDIQKLQRYLVGDYKGMKEQYDAEDGDEGAICDFYANVYGNTRKLHKKINALIDNNLGDDPDDVSNGEAARRNKLRKKLLRDTYLFIVPDMFKIIRSMILTYCSDRAPGTLCFDEVDGVVRLTLSLLRTAQDETNKPHRPKQLPEKDINYHYPECRRLIKTLENISNSCNTVFEEQTAHERKAEMEQQRKIDAEKAKARRQREKELLQQEHEERRRIQAEKEAETEKIRREKILAWQQKNAPILKQFEGRTVPRQFTQLAPSLTASNPPNPSYQGPFAGTASRKESVMDDPFAEDIRNVQPIINGRRTPQPPVDNRSLEQRRKPVVAAASRRVASSQNQPQVIVRPHTLPMSNDESDDDAFDPPQQPRRKFVHHSMTPDDDVVDTIGDEENAYVAMDLDSEEEELPIHPIARGVPRARIEEEELSLTQRRLNEEQRLKMLEAQAADIERAKEEKLKAIGEVMRRKAALEIQEREFYEGRDDLSEDGDDDVDLDDLEEEEEDVDRREVKRESNDEEQEEEEDIYGYSGDEVDEGSVEVGTSFPGNNNRMTPITPWTHDDLAELIRYLKFYQYEKKYIEAADKLNRDLDDVIQTAKEHKDVWAEAYLKDGADVPEWVRCIGENVACETFGEVGR